MPKKCVAFLSLIFLLTSCAARKTVFLSDPPGAEVFVNGRAIGETPCEYEYRTGADTIYEISLHKAEYQSVEGQIATDTIDEQSRNKWMAAGLIWSPLWLGTLFTKKLKDSYNFVLTRLQQAVELPRAPALAPQMISRQEESSSPSPVMEQQSS